MADPKEPKAKRTRGPNKNRVTLDNLRLYCEINIETLMELEMGDIPHPPASTAGQLIAFRRILAKINGNGGAA